MKRVAVLIACLLIAGCASYRLERRRAWRTSDAASTMRVHVPGVAVATSGRSWGNNLSPTDPAEVTVVNRLVREAIGGSGLFETNPDTGMLMDPGPFEADLTMKIAVARVATEDPFVWMGTAFAFLVPARQREWFTVRCDVSRRGGATRSHSRIGVLTIWNWLPLAPMALVRDHRSQRRELLEALVLECIQAHTDEIR